ncbi:hypothetical protein K0C01_10095 [Salinarchaeum sp. IM2453]|uniref:hypothetical protein n=1 Tax=Salinarchaeum sp. IM2453 TaxID=2862870 RepID=UPI001C82B71F|nr:hypothetical protein [Salinarchaeum sp. IM2453]QZA88139.1 hypothetical protein K0C01_10095 [Salinarchaeum sp. IM2453]
MQRTEEQSQEQSSEKTNIAERANTEQRITTKHRDVSWTRIWRRYRRIASQRFNRRCETFRSAAAGGIWSAIIAAPVALAFTSGWAVPLSFILLVGFGMHLFVGYFSRKQRDHFVPAHTLSGSIVIGFLAVTGYISGETGLLFASFYAMMIAFHLPLLGYVLGYFVSDLKRLDFEEAKNKTGNAPRDDEWGRI